jgi:hypothetical protein
MVTRNLQRKKSRMTDVELALAAIEGRPNVLDDPEMAAVSPEPTSLDLPDRDDRFTDELCSNPRCPRPARAACPACGSPLHEGCLRRGLVTQNSEKGADRWQRP